MLTPRPAEHGVAVSCGGCPPACATSPLCSVKSIVISNLIRGVIVPILALSEADGQPIDGPEPHLDEFVKPAGPGVAPCSLWPARSGTALASASTQHEWTVVAARNRALSDSIMLVV